MQEHHLWTDCQHGFRSGRSCCTQLLGVIDDWSRGLDEGLSTDVIYLDYRKAFDSVPHQRLLVKLKAYGIDGNILKWIENFLTGRSQKVVINGECSDTAEVTSGIPQGSVLGPLLFLVYVNDLPRGLNCTAALFADDTKLYKIIRSDVDRAALQNDLNQVAKWSNTWQLPFNVDKCKVLSIGKRDVERQYTMNHGKECQNLTQVEFEKDLGVTFD